MTTFLLAICLGLLPQQSTQDAQRGERGATDTQAPRIDGQWTIVYCEMDGQKVDPSRSNTLTISGNVATFTKEGKQCRVQLNPGRDGMLTATELSTDQRAGAQQDRPGAQPGQPGAGTVPGQGTHRGVYIASQEYLCLCLEKQGSEPRPAAATGAGAAARPAADRGGDRPAEGKMVMILKRGN